MDSRLSTNMRIFAAAEFAYSNGFDTGVNAAKDALRKGIEEILSDDTDLIISEEEVFVPLSALREIIHKLEVK